MSGAEKQGNAVFVRCPSCEDWFAAGAPLIDMASLALYCPSCTYRFLPEDAAEIDRP